MNLDKYVVVPGTPGVHKVVSMRSNGVIIHDSVQKRSRFVPSRQNQFTALATVGMYVDGLDTDTLPLPDIFQKIYDAREEHPPVLPTASSEDLRGYFATVIPEHNQFRVHIADIKKCMKWFHFMLENGLIEDAISSSQKKEAEEPIVETAQKEAEEPIANTEKKEAEDAI